VSSIKTHSQTLFKIVFVVAVCTILFLLPTQSFIGVAISQQEERARSTDANLECVSYCSSIRPGTVLMEVAIRLADGSMSASDLRAKARQQGLDVTVYADGFERGLFANVSAIRPKASFRLAPRTAPARRAPNKIPGLEKLIITDVSTRFDKSAQSLRLVHPSPGSTSEGEWVTVLLEGLDPGLAYTYRVPNKASLVTCQAVVCPVDRIPTPTTRSTRRP